MSLREDMLEYEQITGESAEHVPIIKLGAFLDGYDAAIKALEQEPKTGHWILRIDNNRSWDRRRWYCSCCGDWQTHGETKYCLNCGAKMQEVEE